MLQFIVVGLVFGSIYALAASGLVITYVSTGVLNFAFGAFAFFIARFYYFLHVEKEWGILASVAVSLLVLAPFMGIFFYMAIFRFLRLSSQLIKVVVTIGLSVVIPVLAEIIFGNDEIFQAPGLAPQPVSVYKWFDTAVTLDQVIAYACVIGIVVFGALILRFTEAGLSVRAMVDSEAMTSLSGSNPSRDRRGGLGRFHHAPGRPGGHPRRAGHRPRPEQVHAAHRGGLRRGHRRPAAQPPRRGRRRTAHGHRRQPGAVLAATRQRDHGQHRAVDPVRCSSSSRSS